VVVEATEVDRVGIGWRPELAAGIFAHLDRIDVVEVIADDHFGAPLAALRPLRRLASAVPLMLHGVSLGLASVHRVQEARLASMARLVEALDPLLWSEHLAFVRADGHEIGHLAAPPRNAAVLDGTLANLERARDAVGRMPALENIASLVEPPGSEMSESAWVESVLRSSGAPMLLDLHNLHTNALNFGFDPEAWLRDIPLEQVRVVHLAGGQWTGTRDGGTPRWLDDHCHEVPAPVFALLEEVARRGPQPLTVILERDGAYPPMSVLLAELDAARAALARGRAAAVPGDWRSSHGTPVPASKVDARTAAVLEGFLARLYSEPQALQGLLDDPVTALRDVGLSADVAEGIDRRGLVLAVRSFACKRAAREKGVPQPGTVRRLAAALSQVVGRFSRLRQRYQQATVR
jgi:uncharacterized protein